MKKLTTEKHPLPLVKDAELQTLEAKFSKQQQRIARLEDTTRRLSQRLSESLHYWKIRCDERKTVAKEYLRIKTLAERLETIERKYVEIFKRGKRFTLRSKESHKSKKYKDEALYPLFLRHDECAVLKMLLHYHSQKKKEKE